MRPAILLFAKAPVPGRVKTRLAGLLGAVPAAELHRAFVADMLEMLASLVARADVQLHSDTTTDAWTGAGVPRKLQCEGTLALRMLHALEEELAAGRPQVLILGSDSPTLPAGHVEGLLASQSDVAFGPCDDGGYYGVCCRRTHPDMFRRVEWSTSNALQTSERAALDCGLTVERGAPWFDVDEPDDLVRLLRSPVLPPHTGAWRLTYSP
ncbi:MAG: TIGR04282 family arsenosugar biosynthesis glycosyltransferase [Bryobacteraceae bacterium]